MGAVYRVADLRLSRKPWALKEVTLGMNCPMPATERELLKQEAELLSRLDHPNLPRVVDFFERPDAGCLVMELVEGRTLEQQVKADGPLTPEALIPIARQLCDTLEYLHGRQPPIIFRDLKPGNIMVTPDRKVKLIDFGIARRFAQGKGTDTVALGTPGYAAPEQYGKTQSDPRTDIYGLGATLYFALSGLDPADQDFPLKPLRALFPKLPQALSNLIERCTAVTPSARPASVAEVRKELEPAQAAPTQMLQVPFWRRTRAPKVVPPPPKLGTTRLDFGVLNRGATRQMPIQVQGTGFKIKSDSPWVRVQHKGGQWFASLDGRRVPPGQHQGTIRIESPSGTQHLPVTAELQPERASTGLKVIFGILCVWSLVPVLGVVAFPLLLLTYIAQHSDIRGELTAFVWACAILFCLNALGSEMAWIFFRHLWQS
jgi:serine/threonine protein kinase